MGKRTSGTILFVAGLMSVTLASGLFQSAGSGMVLHLRMEEAAGPTAFDLSGVVPPNNGTWTGGVTSLGGPTDPPPLMGTSSTRCYEFNGTSGYVSVPHNAGLTLPGNMTAALWVYKTADAADWVRLLGKGSSATRTFGIWEEPAVAPALPASAARILFQRYGPSGINFYSTGTVPLNTWTHIACRVNGTAATIFINGVAGGTGTQAQPANVDTEPVTVGYAPGIHTYWQGRIDDVRLYSTALTDTEIAAIAAGTQGPVAPTGLAAVAGDAQVSLTWTPVAGVVYNVKRATVTGGPYTIVGQNISGGAFVDNTAQNGTQYFYVVSGVTYGEGPISSEVTATPMLPVITALPNTGLSTSETPTSTSFDLKVNRVVPIGTTIDVTLTSTRPLEGLLTTGGPLSSQIVVQVVGPQAIGYTQTVTVTGVDDSLADGPQTYQVTVTTVSADLLFNGLTIPPVNLTNNDNDTPAITFTRVAGFTTTESGGSDTFAVTLTTRPFNFIDIPLTNMTPAEVSVSPATLRFTSQNNPTYTIAAGVGTGDWNVSHVVTLTGVDDAVLDFTLPWTVQTGPVSTNDPGDAAYANMATPTLTGVNFDNESIPTLAPVWGGGSGGCGLLGPELLLPFALLALWRRRRGENQPG